MSETELSYKFIEYLNDFDLYFEVGTIDIVAKKGKLITAIEVKKHLNFKVIQQAYENIRASHYSYIAVPKPASTFGYTICEQLGIGVLVYNEPLNEVREKVKPRKNRGAHIGYMSKLTPDSMYKKTTPGAKSGDTITAFSVTVESLEKYVRRHNGCAVKEALNNISHHYGSMASARACILQYIDKGVIKSIRRDKDRIFINNQ